LHSSISSGVTRPFSTTIEPSIVSNPPVDASPEFASPVADSGLMCFVPPADAPAPAAEPPAAPREEPALESSSFNTLSTSEGAPGDWGFRG
jgi:hypothetical protein